MLCVILLHARRPGLRGGGGLVVEVGLIRDGSVALAFLAETLNASLARTSLTKCMLSF